MSTHRKGGKWGGEAGRRSRDRVDRKGWRACEKPASLAAKSQRGGDFSSLSVTQIIIIIITPLQFTISKRTRRVSCAGSRN